MTALTKSLLLFTLNWLDAQLTLVWVHGHVATEGNGLMAPLLGLGDAPFMLAKLAVGFFAAYTLYRCAHLKLARRGMQLVLTVYGMLMITHLATGLSLLGWSQPLTAISYVSSLPYSLITLFS
jgi:hypothetical protein